MSQPIGSHPSPMKPQEKRECVLGGILKIIGDSFEKACTPCEVYCKDRWEKYPEAERVDDYTRRCIQDCRNFQARLP